jgi:hypothetical protein
MPDLIEASAVRGYQRPHWSSMFVYRWQLVAHRAYLAYLTAQAEVTYAQLPLSGAPKQPDWKGMAAEGPIYGCLGKPWPFVPSRLASA